MTLRALNRLLIESLSPFDAENILEHLLGCSKAALILRADEELSDRVIKQAFSLKERRESGEPLQYLLGSWSFMGREYEVGKGVLIPRDDTEVAVSAALSLIPKDKSLNLLDLCSGTGIIAVTLKKKRPLCQVTAVEKSEIAFSYLEKNSRKNSADIRLILHDLADCADSFDDMSLDLIISNPPYIKSGDLPSLQKEISFEPKMALDGGETGYDFYEQIISLYTQKIRKDGYFVFEIGEGQSDKISRILRNAGFGAVKIDNDIQNIPRAITARKEH